MKRLWTIAVLCLLGGAACAQIGVGEWRDNNSFVSARKVCVTPERVYASTRFTMFYYDKAKRAVEAMPKSSGLSDVGVSTFAYDEGTKCLAVAYNNSGLDLKIEDKVYHIADIRYSSIGGDKKIYSIRFDGRRAFLATGFGIVVVNVDKHEIEETWYIGENGDYGIVYDVAFVGDRIVAGTDRGLMSAPKSSPRLHIFETWTLDSTSVLKGMSVRMLDESRGRLLVAACTNNPDSMSVFAQRTDGGWEQWVTGSVNTLRNHNGYIVLNMQDSVLLYDEDYRMVHVVNHVPVYSLPARDADIDADGTLWLGHPWAGMVSMPAGYTSADPHSPSGPQTDDYVYSIVATYDNVYVCPGGKEPTYQSSYIQGGISVFDGERWLSMSRGEVSDEFQDVLYLAVDPKNKKHVSATSWGYGVLDIQDNVLQRIYNKSNSDNALTPYQGGSYEHLRVSGLAYDDQGNLWITNSLVNNGLVVRYRDGSWKSFDISALLQGLSQEQREIDKLVWDSVTGYKWFAGRSNRIYVHDGEKRLAIVNPNNGSKLETHRVSCLVQDRSGDIWFGTDKGLKVIYDGYKAFANGGNGEVSPVNCNNILFNEDGITEYLMAYESISCIAVDGANRKWVGTANNGLYLISANGLEQLHHFTTANSPLASDKIVALAVHPESGVVYVGTDNGLQSYRSTATVGYSVPMADVHAFPNPVRPDYDGPIAIKGFTRDALVHVTDARGHVVFSTTAHGGQAIWNGRTLAGERVASGTYFVFASDELGKMKSVTKVLIIR